MFLKFLNNSKYPETSHIGSWNGDRFMDLRFRRDKIIKLELRAKFCISILQPFFFISRTVDAVKRIEEIKNKRQNHFIKNRLKVGKKLAKEVDLKEIEQNIKLIQMPVKPMKQKVAIAEEVKTVETSMDTIMETN